MGEMQIKGIKDGLLATLGEGDWSELSFGLIEHIKARAGFFQGAKLTIDVGEHAVHASELSTLRDRLSDHGVMLWAVLSNSPITENATKLLGMATKISKKESSVLDRKEKSTPVGEDAILVERTLRSGVVINFRGHVTIVGDINPGAEVIAAGNIVVWGKIRGVVHAGVEGNEHAIICAMDMNPSQLRITDVVAVSPEKRGKVQPEIARIKDGKVVVEVWNSSHVRGK
jgi:septum site-determining protein MinC